MLKIPKSLAHQTIFIDTTAFIAFIDSSNPFHQTTKNIFWELARQRWRLITTNFVVADTYNWIVSEIGLESARVWLKIAHELNIERITAEDEVLAEEILNTQLVQDAICYTMAANFAVMQRLGIEQVFSFKHAYQDFGFLPYIDFPQMIPSSSNLVGY
jgi:predicted nucleic acid-binding protein